MEQKECPMCGELMRFETRNVTDRIPGTPESKPQTIAEWVCPECDYFEDADTAQPS